MEEAQDYSIGVIPVFKSEQEPLFCLVRHSAGHWGFPKGHPDEGETEEQTALRELREETGVDDIELDSAHVFSEHYSLDERYPHASKRYGKKNVKYFLGFSRSMAAAPEAEFASEILGVEWLPYAQARERITYEESKRLLDEVHRHLESGE